MRRPGRDAAKQGVLARRRHLRRRDPVGGRGGTGALQGRRRRRGGPAAGSLRGGRADLARAQPDSTRDGAAALAEALKHPRHAEAARALERGGRGLGDVAELAARLANEVGADVEAAEALVRRARALYGDAAAAATTTVAVAPAPRAAQQRNRVTARAVRARGVLARCPSFMGPRLGHPCL